ncbi:activated RNA polymerase II transcriptional coactivator p15 [Belonocnema kinseyi]|uniref:activated RNA polymerase II transcriptional coactivator p15 n=1 Tax=Belonocnema kinseyi TaxID=2817044 RepID=UPI00143DD129|nr:activated RNA polymerase II transcriptional coactivator p15 [Belonocnema kinseyi]
MPKSKEFVESDDSSASGSSSESEKKGKKRQKKEIKEKEVKGASSSKKSKNENDEPVWEIGQNRRVTIRKWKGKTFIDIRQMYIDNNGDLKHGKQGISLSPELWKGFMEVVDEVNKTVQEQC